MNKTRSQSREHKLIIIIFTISNQKRNQGDELSPLICCKYLIQVSGPQIFVKRIVQPLNLYFTMKTVSLSNAILSFFSWHSLYFHPEKDHCSTKPYSPVFYIHFNLVKFSALTSSNFFCWKYGTLGTQKEQQIWIGDFLDEIQRITFAFFLHLFIQGAPLTHSAMYDFFPNAHNIFSGVIGAYVILSWKFC